MPFLSDSTAVWQVFHHKMHSMYLLPLCVTVVEKWVAYGETWCPAFDPQPGHTNRSLLECRSRTGLKRFSLICYISSMFNIRLSTFVPIISPYHEDLALPVASHIKKNHLWKMHCSFVLQANTPPPPSNAQREYQTQVFVFTKEFLSLVRPLYGLVMIELGSSLARS